MDDEEFLRDLVEKIEKDEPIDAREIAEVLRRARERFRGSRGRIIFLEELLHEYNRCIVPSVQNKCTV